jgi:hypothetical protein
MMSSDALRHPSWGMEVPIWVRGKSQGVFLVGRVQTEGLEASGTNLTTSHKRLYRQRRIPFTAIIDQRTYAPTGHNLVVRLGSFLCYLIGHVQGSQQTEYCEGCSLNNGYSLLQGK